MNSTSRLRLCESIHLAKPELVRWWSIWWGHGGRWTLSAISSTVLEHVQSFVAFTLRRKPREILRSSLYQFGAFGLCHLVHAVFDRSVCNFKGMRERFPIAKL